MVAQGEMQSLWENLHGQERFLPSYPSELAVRFVMTQFPRDRTERSDLRILDIGCGAGRHTMLWSEQGFQTFASDISFPGLAVAHEQLQRRALDAHLINASMRRLPFPDGCFAGVMAFGVVYYDDLNGLEETVGEIHRVLKPGGKAQVITRTTKDYRYGKGRRVDRRSFLLTIDETNEKGMVVCFLSKSDVKRVFRKFSEITVDQTTTTTGGWRVDSDWVIVATK